MLNSTTKVQFKGLHAVQIEFNISRFILTKNDPN